MHKLNSSSSQEIGKYMRAETEGFRNKISTARFAHICATKCALYMYMLYK